MSTAGSPNLRHAIVLGGGICGLATAGVLSRHFEQVTVVEQDRYGEAGVPRLHAPQGAHIHILLAGGLMTLTRLVPTLPAMLDEQGLESGDLTEHTRAAYNGRWLPRVHSGIPIRVCTRGHVEGALLRDVRGRKRITLRDGHSLVGFLGEGRITGVRLASGSSAAEDLTADLVVDAMGRGSPTARLLKARGMSPVEEVSVDPNIGYATAWFEEPADLNDDWMLLGTLPAFPAGVQMAGIIRFRSTRRLHASLITYGKPRAPRSPEELVARMGELPVPQLQKLLGRAKPLSEVVSYGNTQNRWRRYGRLPNFPDGLIVIGDAACSLNPRYGQGMTVAALGAERLDRDLGRYLAQHGHLQGFSRHFQSSLEGVLAVPWQMALLEDRLWVSLFAGESPSLQQRIIRAVSGRLLQAAFTDIDTYIRFMRVAHLLQPPSALMVPRTLLHMLTAGRQAGAGSPPSVGIS